MKQRFYPFLVLLVMSALLTACASMGPQTACRTSKSNGSTKTDCPTFKQSGNIFASKKDRTAKKFGHGVVMAQNLAPMDDVLEGQEKMEPSFPTDGGASFSAAEPLAIDPPLTASTDETLTVLPQKSVVVTSKPMAATANEPQLRTPKPKKGLLQTIGAAVEVKKQLREAKKQPRDGQSTQVVGDGATIGLLSLIFGAISLSFAFTVPLIGGYGIGFLVLPFAATAFVLGIIALKTTRGRMMGLLGLIFSSIILALFLFAFIYLIALVGGLGGW